MANKSEQELRHDLEDVETQIDQARADADELRAEVGGQSDGSQDAEDVAATLNNVEEIEAVLAVLEQRRETVLRQLDDNA